MAKPRIAGPVRTAVQMAPAVVVTEFIDAFFYDFDERQYTVFAAALTLVFSFGQNLFEELKGRAFMKENPAD